MKVELHLVTKRLFTRPRKGIWRGELIDDRKWREDGILLIDPDTARQR